MGPIPMLDQFAIIREAAGPSKGRVQPGVSKRLKLPKLTHDSDISSLSQESIRETIETQVALQVEERLRAEREHRVALEAQTLQVEERLMAEREHRVTLETQDSQVEERLKVEREKREAMELQLTQQGEELEMMRRSMMEMKTVFQSISDSSSTPKPHKKFRF